MSNSFTKEVQWFMDILRKEFSVDVAKEEIGVEATELGIDQRTFHKSDQNLQLLNAR